MDAETAKRYADEFLGQEIAGFKIESFLDHGKSAVVFVANGADVGRIAIKVFERSLVERHGDKQQLRRVLLEKKLGESPHPNIVRVFDAGYFEAANVYYVAMEYVNAPNLERRLAFSREPMQAGTGIYVLRQLIGAAKHLEGLGFAHRDIKPSNIAITNDGAITLLDLGVLRAVGNPNGTDDAENRNFVGTLRYSPPEFLLRKEEDTTEGWRAVTVYQIAAVGHDVITGRMLFEGVEPYARLVDAVLRRTPAFESRSYPTLLVNTIKLGLSKDPAIRLTYADLDQLEAAINADDALTLAKDRVRSRIILRRAGTINNKSAVGVLSKTYALRTLESAIAGLPLDALPRAKIFEAFDGSVCALFDDLDKFDLGDKFEVLFSVDILDATDRMVKVKAFANQTTREAMRYFESQNTYAGICEVDQLSNWLEATLYDLIDQAQDKGTEQE